MSVRTMAKVWERSRHAGSELLMLLAIADFADDDGKAYPAVTTLADKCRMTSRNANLILASLRRSGELVVRQNEGPKGTNLYQIVHAPTPEAGFTPEERFTLKPASPTPEAGFLKPLKPASDEPSVNHQEPPHIADGTAVDQCPHQSIIDLYHRTLPTGRMVKVWNATRKTKLRARWREDKKRQSLAWWERLFSYIAESEFLTGKTSTPGRPPFELDLEWIISPANLVKIIEGKYHRQETAA
jgi:hypothetical protein